MSWRLIVVLLIFILSSCSVTKRSKSLTDSFSGKINLTYEDLNSINLTTFDFNIRKATIELNGKFGSQKILANIRYRRPCNYLISLNSRLGIEVARIFLDSDTVLINDRINRKLFYGSLGYIEAKYGISKNAIPLIFGDYIFESNGIYDKCINGKIGFIEFVEDHRISGEINCSNYKIINVLFGGESGVGQIQIQYDNFMDRQGVIFPRNIKMNDNEGDISLTIDYSDVDFDAVGDINFVPGSGYQRVLLQ